MSEWIESGRTLQEFIDADTIIAGMLLEVEYGKKTWQCLIGHTNENLGGCDCCSEFKGGESKVIVKRYMIVWSGGE